MKQFSFLFSFLSLFSAHAQSFTGSGGSIPDDGTTIEFNIPVSGLSPSTIDTNFGLKTVCINLDHTWNADLEIYLIAPDGTIVPLTLGNGGDSDGYDNTCFDMSSSTSITSGWGPFIGTYLPQGNLGNVNNGQNGNGTWKLRIYDNYAFADAGVLFDWSVTFGTNAPAPSEAFVSSNLPIVVINTNSQTIVNDPKIIVDMGIIYNGPGVRNYMTDPFQFDGNCGIEIRGSSSSSFPKKGYGLETCDSLGNSVDTSLLGMPKENDWILSASYSDKSLMNNVLAYKIFRDFGFYAPRTEYVELVIDGQYQGVYVLMEKIKRDKDRVNIAKLNPDDTTGADLTGGYIIKIDKSTGAGGDGWTSPYPPSVSTGGQTIFFQYEYPDQTVIHPAQKTYIQSFVDSFETALATMPLTDITNGWRAYADEWSFIHYFMLNEVSRNVDGYRLSTYLFKTKQTAYDLLVIGPPWDYDIAFGNANYCDGSATTGWAYQFGDVCSGDFWQVPFWWEIMMSDTLFQNNLKCLYTQARATTLDTTNLFGWIDTTANWLDEGQTRNFETWNILGSYVWPNPMPVPTTYQEEVDELKKFLRERIAWLDANIPGTCTSINVPNIEPLETKLDVYPNPFANEFSFAFTSNERISGQWSLVNTLGEILYQENVIFDAGKTTLPLHLSLSPGSYGFVLTTPKGSWSKIIVKQ